MKNDIDYSIIIPVYFNEGLLRKTYEKLMETVVRGNPDKTYEIIFVDDGSDDASLEEALDIRSGNPGHVRAIKFTRNFGQVAAIRAGYRHARGKCVINISADLQDPPELINQMMSAHFVEGYEVVICARDSREESWFRRKTSKMFYRMMRRLSFPYMPEGGFDYVLISRDVKNLILSNSESNPFWQGQILWTGFKFKTIPYKRRKREVGTSRWTFSKKIKYLIDGVMGYSYFPLRMISIFGMVISMLGFLYAVFIVLARILGKVPFKGWAPIMILVLVLSGIQMLMLGIIGEYLWRTLDQTRNRQPYVIEKIYED